MVRISGGSERYVVEIDGKDRKSLTGKVRGRVQEHVKTMRRYPDAIFRLNRNEGLIDAIGVPREALEQALDGVQSELSPKNRFTYTVEAGPIEEPADAPEQAQPPEDRDKAFAIWTEQAQKDFDAKAEAYETEIARLSSESKRLVSENQILRELRKEGDTVAEALKKENEKLRALYDNASSQLSQSPEEAARDLVARWSRLADRVDETVAAAAPNWAGNISELADFTLSALHSEVTKMLAPGAEVGKDLRSIEAIAEVGPFDGTDEYRRSNEAYTRAKEELEYLRAVQSGSIAVPDFVKDMLSKNVDVERNHSTIESFEALRQAHSHRSGKATEVRRLLDRYRAAEALREVKPSMRKERPLPIAVFSDLTDGHWYLETLFPSVKGIVRESCMHCVEKAASDVGLKNMDVKAADSVTRIRYTLPKSVRDWRDVSKKQEAFTWGLASQFNTCPIHMLGVKVRITKMMDLGTQTERVELELPSRSEEDESPAKPQDATNTPLPSMMIHGLPTEPKTGPSQKR